MLNLVGCKWTRKSFQSMIIMALSIKIVIVNFVKNNMWERKHKLHGQAKVAYYDKEVVTNAGKDYCIETY